MIFKESTRAYIYRVCVAGVPLLTFYGLIAENSVSLWLGLSGAILATGNSVLAAVNTSTDKINDVT